MGKIPRVVYCRLRVSTHNKCARNDANAFFLLVKYKYSNIKYSSLCITIYFYIFLTESDFYQYSFTGIYFQIGKFVKVSCFIPCEEII